MKDAGIYIHVPFCERKCRYCDFYSVKKEETLLNAYVEELLKEIRLNASDNLDKKILTLYFGGGTPSLLGASTVGRIIDAVTKYYCTDFKEVTIEVNPNSAEDLDGYKKAGVNRLSVGVQSTDDRILKKLGRLHKAETALKVLEKGMEVFGNVSADLIIGADSEQDVSSDLDRILPRCTHLSSYMLSLEEGTPLSKAVSQKKVSIATEIEVLEQYKTIYDVCLKNGFYRYEVSNFSFFCCESVHNFAYWKMKDYLGFGPGAHSYVNGERYYNPSDVKAYVGGAHSGLSGQISERYFSLEEEKSEFIMLALRTRDGIDVAEYNRRFSEDFFERFGSVIKKLSGFLTVSSDRVSIRPEFLLVQNSIILELI